MSKPLWPAARAQYAAGNAIAPSAARPMACTTLLAAAGRRQGAMGRYPVGGKTEVLIA